MTPGVGPLLDAGHGGEPGFLVPAMSDSDHSMRLIRVASELSAAPLLRIILAGQKVMRVCLMPVASGAVVRGGMT
jgi:hypothetical protein